MSADLPKCLQKRSQRIAIDFHEVPYHGQPFEEAHEIRRGQSRRGTNRFHDYATAYVVRKGYRFTLAMAWIRQTYRKRFGIETSYRQMERARIRTTTRDPLRRRLFAGIVLLLRNAWVWLHLMRLASRHGAVVTLHLERLRFTNLLLKLQTFAEHLCCSEYRVYLGRRELKKDVIAGSR